MAGNKNIKWFVDTETGGLDCNRHSILSVAFVKWVDGKIEDEKDFGLICEDAIVCDQKALEINKIDLKDVREYGLRPDTIVSLITDFVFEKKIESFDLEYFSRTGMLAGHNVQFDVGFLKRLFRLSNRNYPFDYHTVDTMVAAGILMDSGKIPQMSYKLKSLCDYFGVKRENEHTALGDARAAAELYTKILEVIKW